jgi:hypothetical protein
VTKCEFVSIEKVKAGFVLLKIATEASFVSNPLKHQSDGIIYRRCFHTVITTVYQYWTSH